MNSGRHASDSNAAKYEPPTVTEVGTVTELTRGQWGWGTADNFTFRIWGYEITIPYGVSG